MTTEQRKIKTLKDTNYFASGTYKGEFKDYLFNVGITNVITRIVLAPIERWRIIQQTQLAYPSRPLHFTSLANYIQRIPKEQGVSAFWRGTASGIWLFLTQSLIQVGFYDNLKALQKDLVIQEEQDSFFRLLSERMFIPIISTFFTQVVTYPIDTARVRLTMNYAKEKEKFPFFGIRTCLSHLREEQSFQAIYKGFLLSNVISLINFNLFLVFASVAAGLQQGEQLRDYVNSDTIASVGALALVHPLDTLN